MSNFDFLTKHDLFSSFSFAAVNAEKCLKIDPNLTITQCRTVMEKAINWMYDSDDELTRPEDTKLCSLINNYKFVRIVGRDLICLLNVVRKAGNSTAHSCNQYDEKTALLVLNSLFRFLDWIDQNYTGDTEQHIFDNQKALNALDNSSYSKDIILNYEEKIKELSAQNSELARQNSALSKLSKEQTEQLTAARKVNIEHYVPPVLDEATEAETRRFLIDVFLSDAGWVKGKDWKEEILVPGMNNQSGNGYADYVLYDDDGIPLAVVEAKRVKVPVETARQQAKIYADLIEKKYGYRPVVFTTNGNVIHIIYDENYPEREVSSIYSKADLQFLRFKHTHKQPLTNYDIDSICERYYQKDAINAVCEHFSDNYRKSLLVMATGSGKTRTILGLIKVLAEKNWVKNVLFLADRTALVSQAYGAAKTHLNSFPLANLCDEKKEERDPNARIVFATYQTMMSTIDSALDENGNRIFTNGHFNLIICDEAHRSIYNRYKEIFRYFDSLLVGLTATPKNEIDKNTYQEFGLEVGDPTYYYPLETAVKDDFLVDFHTIKFDTDFSLNGIKYSELSDEDKKIWDDAFADDEENYVEEVNSGAINKWLFNRDTIKKVISALMEYGLKIDSGDKIGKSIIFARNHKHAEEIVKVFNDEYPKFGGEFCQVIDNKIKAHDSLIEQFKKPNKNPQIAVSVDMLDTGVDVPECLNLVFFKPVYSYAKFWQMIGRGTRKCPGLIDGEDKKYFVIIDACQNFSFFEENPHGMDGKLLLSLEHRTFVIRTKLLKALQNNGKFDSKDYRENTVKTLAGKVRDINQESFTAKSHIGIIQKFSKEESFENLTDEVIEDLDSQVGELLLPSDDDIRSRRFDNLMYGIELNYVKEKRSEFNKLLACLRKISTLLLEDVGDRIDDIRKNRPLLENLLKDEFIQSMTLKDYEHVREIVRNLVVYIDPKSKRAKDIYIDVEDSVSNIEVSEDGVSKFTDQSTFEPYKNRVQRYVREHLNEGVIYKIHNNVKLSEDDIKDLENIVWNKLGSKEEYISTYSDKNVGVLIREIAGLDIRAAKEAFSKFMSEHNLSVEQTAFVNLVIDYIVQNGLVESRSILLEPPFDRFPIEDYLADDSFRNDFFFSIENITSNAQIRI